MCIRDRYNTTFTVNPFVYSYTLTPTTTTICTSGGTPLTVNFGNITPQACALSTTGGCSSPGLFQVGNGSIVNTNTGYPAPYGNYFKNTRHQMLYTAAELIAAGLQPVSYTHLDVYKRQPPLVFGGGIFKY